MFGLAALGALAAAGAIWASTRPYVRETCTPGRVSPPAPAPFPWLALAFARAIVFLQVGRVRVRGLDVLTSLDGPAVIAANHGHYADGFVLARSIGCRPAAYYFIARGALAWGGGLAALVFGPAGTVAVDLRRGHGGAALRTGARLLAAGGRVVLFPEGWAHMDGSVGTFKAGAVWMAREASRRRRRLVPVVPVAVTYPRHPGRWITRLSPAAQYALTFVLFPFFRRGATVAVGTPISTAALDTDAGLATDQLRQAIAALRARDTA